MRKARFVIAVLLFLVLFFIPLISVFSNISFKDIKELLTSTYNQKIIWFTVKQASLSTLLSLVLGLPGAWIIAKYNFKFKRIIKVIYYIPFVLPAILVVLGFVISYSKLNILYSLKAVLLAHVFFNFPVIINIISNKWTSLDQRIEDAARASGANELVVFKQITLPRLLPGIVSACIIVFLFCFTSFAIILVLGGGPKLTTIEVEIYKLSRINFNLSKASSMAIISLLIASVILCLYNVANKSSYEEQVLNNQNKMLNKESILTKVFVYFYLVITTLFLIFPIIGICYRSLFGGTGFSLNAYRTVSFAPIFNTLLIGLLSSLLTIILSVFLCSEMKRHKSKILETLLMMPMATSSIIIGLGYFIIGKFSQNVSDLLLIVLCHGILNCPYAIKTILPVYRSISKDQIEAAMVSGANDFTILTKVELPNLKESIVSAGLFTFALSCGELNSTLMISKSDFVTIPVQIQRLIGAYNYNGACAYGTILVILSAVLFTAAQKLKAVKL